MRREDLKTEFNALVPVRNTEQGASRRAALKVALGAGYAAVARPIMAQSAIRTSSEGLKTGEASYQVSGFAVPVYFAAPAGRTHWPVLGLYGGQVGGLPLTTINQMKEALAAAARPSGIQRPKPLNSWCTRKLDTRPMPTIAPATAKKPRRMVSSALAWFKAHGVA